MIDQRTPGIEPPPSLDEILSHPERIGRVDFTHRLVPEPAPEPTPEPEAEQRDRSDDEPASEASVVEAASSRDADGPVEEPAEEPAEEPVQDAAEPLRSVPTILPVVSDLADEVVVETEPDADDALAEGDEAVEPTTVPQSVDEHDHEDTGDHFGFASGVGSAEDDPAVHDLRDLRGLHDQGADHSPEEAPEVLELSEPVTALLSLVPAEDAAVVAEDVHDVVAGVIGRIREVRSATIAHLEAIEVESALRCEMLTAQAELDAELIRLHARREAHAIIAASRHRAGLPARNSSDEQRLAELHAAATRLSEELEALGVRPGSPDHPFSR